MKKVRMTILLLALATAGVQAQSMKFSDIDGSLKMSQQISAYADEITAMSKSAKKASTIQRVEAVEESLKTLDFKYDLFFQTHTIEIAAHEGLQSLVLSYQESRQVLVDSLAAKRSRFEARDRFDEAATFLVSQDSTYRDLYKKSVSLSLTPQTAKALEKLKALEQIKFAAVQENYDKLCAAAQAEPSLADSAATFEDRFIELKSYSSKIQEAEYKPLLQRIKDYLMSIAAVTIVLMFFVMIQSRISSAKQYRASMKKVQEQFAKKDNDIPSI